MRPGCYHAPMGQLIFRGALSGDFSHADWTNPANPPPDSARPFRVTATSVVFDIIGKASTAEGAAEVDVGGLTIDAWIAYETGTGGFRRETSIVESSGQPLTTRIRLVSTEAVPGEVGRFHLALTNVGALTAVDVELVAGGRRLR